MTFDVGVTCAILALTLGLFVSDRLRSDVVALISLLALALTGLAPTDVALSGFSNPAVLMIAGLFVVGAAITGTGVADWVGRRLDRVAGSSPAAVIAVVMVATGLLSAFMSSTGTVALLLPVVGTLAAQRGIPPGQLLMPLAFAAHLGSNLTLIATPPNLIVSDALRAAGREPFRFFDFTLPGAAVFVVGVAYLALVGRRSLPQQDEPLSRRAILSDRDLAAEYGLDSALRILHVPPGSPLVGLSLATANLRASCGVTIVGLTRGAESLHVVPQVTFEEGDWLRVVGSEEAIAGMRARFGTEDVGTVAAFELPSDETLLEVVLPRRSRLVGRTLRGARFRDRYRANVLGVRRVADRTKVNVGSQIRDLPLRAGDALLLKGRRKYLRKLRDERDDLVLVAEPDAPPGTVSDRPRALAAVAITLVMLVVMAFGWVPNVIAVLAAALAVVLAGAVRPVDVYRSVNWESVVLIACMIPLATTLERTGATTAFVGAIVGELRGVPPVAVLGLLVVVTSALGMVLSNTATAILLAPVALQLAGAFGLSPEPLLMGVAFASSAAFATPIASPVNVLVMTPGGYRFADYARVGLPLQALVLATAVAVIPLVWPF